MLAVPESSGGKLFFVFSFPLLFAFALTIPDVHHGFWVMKRSAVDMETLRAGVLLAFPSIRVTGPTPVGVGGDFGHSSQISRSSDDTVLGLVPCTSLSLYPPTHTLPFVCTEGTRSP